MAAADGAAVAAVDRFPVGVAASVAAEQEGVGKVMHWFSTTPSIDHDRVVAAIGEAESRTSGEIRVVVSDHKAPDPVAAAKRQFERLGMTGTRMRNGVLIFIATRSRTFAVIGDTGVHEKCSDQFWTELAGAMTGYFKKGDFTAGLVHGIERAGVLLAEHFPHMPGDGNELPDEIEEAD